MAITHIPDGYTMPGYIEEEPRLHSALRFTYRPCVMTEVSIIDDAVSKAGPARAEAIAAECCAGHIVEWDAVDGKGSALPLTAKSVERFQPALFALLYRIIRGSSPSDVDPDEKNESATYQVPEGLQAALTGTTVEAVAEKKT